MAIDEPAVRALRLVSIVTWLPSLGLSVAHGILSRQAYPSAGIIPHTVSAILALCLLRIPRESAEPESESDTESTTAAAEEPHKPGSLARILHPFVVFLLDIAISAGFVWVLVMTWLQGGRSNQISMLAAYTTVPLMANFAASVGSGLHSIYKGLAINGIVQWLAWRVVPAECPGCSRNLRPASLPEIPWLKRSKRRDVIAPVLVEERYRDESDIEEDGMESAGHQGNDKGKSTPTPSNPDLPWGGSGRVY